ncbi:hypothetical protein Ais01nite_41080 [Asanoa ishikariensis]|uniref:Uncharacterized protein n=1 Tax=Asanoa ishikariensis TaxID=137265 RepID=A0A1H3MEV6_9ACTN|nr:hypothetical protein [Asanoa ishikariensis]GIF66073.1 hypothetical protein Ais01nite_41080 [Asanoa ishikariensis]SDY74864.1 hypothetical protein SAMN05421684_1346 [Asanoa ishikariensis]
MMVGRRGGRRVVALFAIGVGLVGAIGVGLVVSAGSASAADERIDLRAARAFNAGGNPGSASVSVTRRDRGCINVRTALGIRLANGMNGGQVRVDFESRGQWRPVVVSDAGPGVVVTERTAPDRSTICERQTAVGRYRVSFADGTPGGSVTLIGQVFNGRGQVVGSESAAARVNGAKVTPTKKATKPPKSAPPTTPTKTEEPLTADPFDDPAKSPLAVAVPVPPHDSGSGGFLGMSGLVMFGGLVLVGVGAALIVFLVRQMRADRAGGRPTPDLGRHTGGAGQTAAPESQTMFLPPMRPATGPGSDQQTVIFPRIED